jgi:N-terminal acetyltransferase B complex non-catalytic subunit
MCSFVVGIFSQLGIDTGDLRQYIRHANNTNNAELDCTVNLTEDGLNAVYGRLEVLRVLNRLLEFMRPISKARNHAFHKEITPAMCELLHKSITEFYHLHRIRIRATIDRLYESGVAHIRAQLLYGKTGAAVDEVISDETLTRYSKEYADSAIEALKGVLKVQLG